MRPWSLLFLLLVVPLLLLAAAPASGSGATALPGDGAAAALVVEERREQSGGSGGRHNSTAEAAERAAFYLKVGRFAVIVHSFWHEIKPVPKVERVESVSFWPAKGGGVDYLLVLRVGPPLGKCRALVWGVPGEGSQDWKLKSFVQVA